MAPPSGNKEEKKVLRRPLCLSLDGAGVWLLALLPVLMKTISILFVSSAVRRQPNGAHRY